MGFTPIKNTDKRKKKQQSLRCIVQSCKRHNISFKTEINLGNYGFTSVSEKLEA